MRPAVVNAAGEVSYRTAWARRNRGATALRRKARFAAETAEQTELRRAKARAYYAKTRTKQVARSRDYHERNRDLINERGRARRNSKEAKDRSKNDTLLRKYGISLSDFQGILACQGNGCAICKNKFSDKFYPHVDHCHKTKKVRGLLCLNCNAGIGSLQENPQIFKSALDYLAKEEGVS